MTPPQRMYLILWALTFSVLFICHYCSQIISSILITILVITCFKTSVLENIELAQQVKQIKWINFTVIIFGVLLEFSILIFDTHPGLSLFIVNNVIFHMGEMLHVSFYKSVTLCWNSFLINYSRDYNLAISLCLCEYIIESFYMQPLPGFIYIGFILTTIGQVFRIGAFINAKNSFNHQVQEKKAHDHVLVTTGIYSISRHPSYFGFWIYSLGQQVMLQNPISFILYIPVLYDFFIKRIRLEEKFLREFFGQEYITYASRTPVLIPFIESFI